MSTNLPEIAALAEHIAEENISRGKVNLEKIIKKKGITIISGNYGNYFVGELIHKAKKFYIIVNQDMIDPTAPGRLRFTIAHELGHYFIDDHRKLLKKGISLSHNSDYNLNTKSTLEKEANHFASNLLMPKARFINTAKKFEPGLKAIIGLKQTFEASFESTAIHYLKQDLNLGIFIKWKMDQSFHYASYSPSFGKRVGISGAPPIRFEKEYIENIFSELDELRGKNDYIENATTLSKWLATISPSSKNDLIGLEQTIPLGNYGWMTFLAFA
ncbi:MAG: ImmA/IrrE family metallo-endopeptidase [Bacteroidota bacterium]|nr:ImmA/IrrE family metallo-endopeptidase [Bacteroidota bacterium]